ncbi:MAG: hypothetical protein KDI10_19155 [Halioglobus sp.]|nr:hypothetical protein [Halioglobus sp.]MCP5122437.1 hypothetical protein [Pseudomonadales bacterium]MCP5191605.1 hypothetical protein [Pseudomonadales bacterium]
MNLLLVLLGILAGVALMAALAKRFGGDTDPVHVQRLQRWILPLVGLMLVLSVLKYYV